MEKPLDLIIKKIYKELNVIQGDTYIDEVAMNSIAEEKISEYAKTIKKLDLVKSVVFKEGKFEAYMSILELLENYYNKSLQN